MGSGSRQPGFRATYFTVEVTEAEVVGGKTGQFWEPQDSVMTGSRSTGTTFPQHRWGD